MSDLPQTEVIETVQVPAWRFPAEYKDQFWNPQWRRDREKDLEDIRGMLAHLEENKDWFFVTIVGSDVDVFFTDARQAVYFKLRHVV